MAQNNRIVVRVVETDAFQRWICSLRDDELETELTPVWLELRWVFLGDIGPVGDGVSELRIHYGPGYRIYFITRGNDRHGIALRGR